MKIKNLLYFYLILLLLVSLQVSSQTLTHSYTFEDGTANDGTGTLHGTLVGDKISIADGKCTVAGATTSGATKSIDGYITFDAAKLALKNYSAISLEFSIICSPTSNGNYYTMLAYFGNNTGGRRCLWFQPTRGSNNTESRAETNNGGTTSLTAPYNVEVDDTKPHHIAVVLTMDSLRYFLDGSKVSAVATGGDYITTLDTVTAYLFKGAWSDPNFNASIDEFKIYDGALSATQIADNAKSFLGPSDSRLTGISVDAGSLIPSFDQDIKEYAVLIPSGTTTINLSATPYYNGSVVTGTGAIDVSSGSVTDTIKVKSFDETSNTNYVVHFTTEKVNCFTPSSQNPNLIPDPELTDITKFVGWGVRSINVNPSYTYCGSTSGKVEGINGGSINISMVNKLKTFATYSVKAMVYVPNTGTAKFGITNVNVAEQVLTNSTQNDTWETLEAKFSTKNSFVDTTNMELYFNNNQTAAQTAYIDNWEFYENPLGGATLSDLSVDGATVSDFDSTITNYTVELPYGSVQAPTVTGTRNDPNATITITDAAALPGYTSVRVASSDSTVFANYQVTFTIAPPSTDATLSDLKLDDVTINGFDPATMSYDVILPPNTSPLPQVTVETSHDSATYAITQATTLPGSATVTVTAQDGSTMETYTVNFTTNSDATLADLMVDGTTVNNFDTETTSYDVSLAPGTTTVPTVTASANNNLATVNITPASALPGSTTVLVTAGDGVTQKTYTINFSIASTDATLSDLMVGGTTVTGFSASTLSYDSVLPIGTSTVPTVTAVTSNVSATLDITPAPSLPGTTTVRVTAQDGSTKKTYKINFTVTPNFDATLSDLQVNDVTVSGFSSSQTDYTVMVLYGDKTIPKIKPITNDPNASTKITQASSIPGSGKVEVTAEDGTSTLTYTINFEIAVATGAETIGSDGSLSAYPNPASSILNTSVSGDLIVTSLSGTIMATGKGASIDISHLPSGTYFIKVTSQQSVQSIKFIKK